MNIFWIMTGLFVFITIVFVLIAIYLPEWVGITGKKAEEVMAHQRGESQNSREENQGKPQE